VTNIQSSKHEEENKRKMIITVVNNGFTLKTRSGIYIYHSISELLKAVTAYSHVIKKEIERPSTQEVQNDSEKNSTRTQPS
jgi:hypothetical protein